MKPAQIKKLRLSLGLLQSEFARKLGVTSRTVRNLESGRSEPNEYTQTRLKKFREQNRSKPRLSQFTPAQIRKLRKRMDLSQPLFASKLGITKRALRKLECGDVNPSLATLKQLNRLVQRVQK